MPVRISLTALFLLAAALIAAAKPWGLTPYGRRHRDRLASGA